MAEAIEFHLEGLAGVQNAEAVEQVEDADENQDRPSTRRPLTRN
jgi:hypothetical protein